MPSDIDQGVERATFPATSEDPSPALAGGTADHRLVPVVFYQMEAERRLPNRIKIGARSVGWIESEVQTRLRKTG
jgi:Prophage CP4-57 regulatory protein (AlpA)